MDQVCVEMVARPIGELAKLVSSNQVFSNGLLVAGCDVAALLYRLPVLVDSGSLVAGSLTIAVNYAIGSSDLLVTYLGHLQPREKTAYVSALYREVLERHLPHQVQEYIGGELLATGYVNLEVSLSEIELGYRLMRSCSSGGYKEKGGDH